VLEIVRNGDIVDDIVFDTYFEDSKIYSLTDSVCTVIVQSFIHEQVLREYLTYLSSILSEVLNVPITCQIALKSDVEKVFSGEQPVKEFSPTGIYINPDYTFDNFVVGQSNAEPHAAALAVSCNPGRFYNPLFIYGATGLGKTHLLQSIANYISNKNPEFSVLLMTASDFVDGVVKYQSNLDYYKKALSKADVFLIDDVQFLVDKKKSEEIFFYVFNELVDRKKQIVLTSDCDAREIKGLEDRLVSRFSGGLTVSISAPEFETAVRIIKSKIEREAIGLDIDDKVIDLIAANYSSDIRQLEGTLNRLIFNLVDSDDNETIDLNFALSVLKEKNHNYKELTVKAIKDAIREKYGLSRGQLEGKSRMNKIVQARHIAMYLCRKHLDLTFDAIGEAFGKRDHSTVMSACDRIERLIKTDKAYKIAVNQVEDLFINN